jgi:dTDP-4-dehydrorhamnose reductase
VGPVAEVLHQRQRAAGGGDRAVPLASVPPAAGRLAKRALPGLEPRDEDRLGAGIAAGRTHGAETHERSCHNRAERARAHTERRRREPALAPLAVRELVPGQRAAHKNVRSDHPLLLGVEHAERKPRRRRRLRPGALRALAAADEETRHEKRAGAPVDSAAMRVLVTGASGFVGRALVEELRHKGRAYDVHGLERGDGDLADDGVAQRAIAAARPEIVVHAAARIGVARCDGEPLLALRSNVLATVHVARACAEHGARLAYVSTADVYGAVTEAGEDTPPLPASLYALTKWWGEQAARLYAPDGLVVVRLANPYGPGVEPGQGKGALPTMLDQAQRAEPIPAFRGERRSWCWIGDVVRAIGLVLESRAEGVFNVGSDAAPVALADAARLVCELTGASPDLVDEVDPPPGRVAPRISVDRLRALGWRPETTLEEGLRLTLQSRQAAIAP